MATDLKGASSGLVVEMTKLHDVSGPWTDASAKPFVNDVDPGAGAKPSDFTLSTNASAAGKPVVFSKEPFTNPDGSREMVADLLQWNPLVTDINETVYGIFITDALGTSVLGYTRLALPFLWAGADVSLPILVRHKMPVASKGSVIQASE